MKCRLCDGIAVKALDLGEIPLVDRFTAAPERQETYPIGLAVCTDCGHVQLTHQVAPSLLFSDYLFRTADTPYLVEHYRKYAADLADFDRSYCIDIGSNDGTLLECLAGKGKLLGIDPSNVPANVTTMRDYFTRDLAIALAYERKATLITANHVFAHVADMNDFVAGIKELLAPRGTFVFEAAYCDDMLARFYPDQIYHEHMSFHSVHPLAPLFARYGLTLLQVQHNDCKGGSIRGFVRHAGWMQRRSDNNRSEYMRQMITIEQFARRLIAETARLADIPEAIGYGAAAPCMALMYHLGLSKRVPLIVDDYPRRRGMYAPNGALVVGPEVLYESDYPIIVLAQRYAEPIIAKHPKIPRERFIVPCQ